MPSIITGEKIWVNGYHPGKKKKKVVTMEDIIIYTKQKKIESKTKTRLTGFFDMGVWCITNLSQKAVLLRCSLTPNMPQMFVC